MAVRKEDFFKRWLRYSLVSIIFMLPLFRGTMGFGLEAPKFYFSMIAILVVIIFAAVGFLRQKIDWTYTHWFKFIIPFLVIMVLATYLSISPIDSLTGNYVNYGSSSLMVLVGALFFYLILLSRPEPIDIIRFLRVLLIFGGLIGIHAVLESLGVLGNPSASSSEIQGLFQNNQATFSYIMFVLPFSIYFYLKKGEKNYWRLISLVTFSFMAYAAYLLSDYEIRNLFRAFHSLFIDAFFLMILLMGLIYPYIDKFKKIKTLFNNPKKMKIYALILLVALGLGIFESRSLVGKNLKDSLNPLRYWSREVAMENGKNNIWFGSGPATITYNLPSLIEKHHFLDYDGLPLGDRYSGPVEYLVTVANFNSTYNEPLYYFSSAGILGLISYLLVWGYIFYVAILMVIRRQENWPLIGTFLASTFLYFGYRIFASPSVSTVFLPWMGAALILILAGKVRHLKGDAEESNLWLKRGISFAAIAASLFLMTFPAKLWLGDYYYAKASKTQNGEYYKKAISLSPSNDLYQMDYSYFEYQKILKEGNLKESAYRKAKSKDAEQTLKLAKRAVEMNPKASLNSLNLGAICLGLQAFDEDYKKEAEKAFREASRLEPENANLYTQIASSYWFTWDMEKAEEYIKKSIEYTTDKNKANAYLTLSRIHLNNKDKVRALEAFKEAQKYPLDKINPQALEATRQKIES
ncbi:MAG: hypothetical protein UU65_C0005G0050 [candidate division CPR2 bacterium GW2011_GWC1_41_48]|uniref:Uncharacterized protein n=1 Tax=candidate division CPR2 bacterium GW2011_GWC1_41_48 TaxID=1618344 RepID=A0A0G0W6Y9_UNCC2|nr:MAG: hypothetical protein UT47_C0005G0050 [candidate division CPR2 bacterium GW2011_GWC2_39_35]KKS08739.1 MAG: hypothetical protein UU65_C0005G0050 [candidate division CPR2 bacterium GW2011_GWC1_41_48]